MIWNRIWKVVAVMAIAISLLLETTALPVMAQSQDGSVLPFDPVPSASIAGPTLQEPTTMIRREEANHLPEDAPNILIILLDDVGFGQADTFGGEIHTPTLSRLWDEGIAYNTFHTTSTAQLK